MNKHKIIPLKKITIWSVKSKSGVESHNHIENGWVGGSFPKPLKKEFMNQNSWEKLEWNKEYGYLRKGSVVRI